MMAAAVTFAGCDLFDDPDNPTEQTLAVTPETVSAEVSAGSSTITVTSNAAWTAAVDAAATWVSLSPASATGDGTVTVNVMENPLAAERAATITFTAGTLTRTVAVTQSATPPHAASTQTWTFGDSPLVWSDRIIASPSNCTQTNSLITDNFTTAEYSVHNGRYYYSWTCAVNEQTTLCPSPWRAPAYSDFEALVNNTKASTLGSDWGYGEFAFGSSVGTGSHAYYWSSEEYGSDNRYAYGLYYCITGSLYVYYDIKSRGYQVRCVKEAAGRT
jgi:hypothetical protein